MKNLLAASALLFASVAQVSAADLVVSEPEPVFSWTGFYAGGHAGIGWGDADYTFAREGGDDFPFENYYNRDAGDTLSHRMSGGLLGIHAGYNQQFDNFVLGLEASLSAAGIGKSKVVSPFYPESDLISTKVEWFATLTPRLGYANDKWLFYGKGGLAYGQVRSRIETRDFDSEYPSDGNHVTETFRRLGWTAGAGVDYALSDNIIIGVDYNYVDLGSHTISRFAVDSRTGDRQDFGSTHDVDTSWHAITARVSWKFN